MGTDVDHQVLQILGHNWDNCSGFQPIYQNDDDALKYMVSYTSNFFMKELSPNSNISLCMCYTQ